MTSEEFVKSLCVHVEGAVLSDMPRDQFNYLATYIRRLRPILLEPRLELCDFPATLNLNVQFHILGKPWTSKVARTDERLRSDHFQFRVCYVGLGVALFPVIYAALDLMRP